MTSARLPKSKKIFSLTREVLVRAALAYVARYAASRAMLERTLRRRVERARQQDANAPVREAEQWIQEIVESHVARGHVNDAQFSQSLLRQGRSMGHSRRKIALRMQHKGLSRAQIAAVFAEDEDSRSAEETDLSAALVFARRKKLGVWRERPAREDDARKDIARLCREGFSPGIARKALKGDEY